MTEQSTYRQRLETRMTDIAERLVIAEGLSAVQARRVAHEADCSVGTLYNIFGGLDGLVIAVNARSIDALGKILDAALRAAAGGGLERRLDALALAYRDYAFQQNNRWRALFEHRMEAGRTVPDDYRLKQAALFTLVEDCLEKHIANTAERRTAARALFSAVHGILWLALDDKLGGQSPEESERQIRFIVSAVARGLPGARRTRIQ